MRLAGLAIVGVSALALAACGKKEAAPAAKADVPPVADVSSPPPATPLPADPAAVNLEAAKAFLAANAKKEGVRTTASGLQYEVLASGPAGGYSPKATDFVTVQYAGTYIDGQEFDSSYKRGAAARFRLDRVIPGWTEGVQLMKEGDRFRFVIPPELAYGAAGKDEIGPNQALIFDVELIKVANAERTLQNSTAWLAANARKPGVVTTKSGLQYQILSKGPGGKKPIAENAVRVHYRGVLIDGTEFDSSYARGQPTEFALAEVIPGWTEGVQLMSVGDKFRFFVPPNLAYGEKGWKDLITPNEALIFDVELLDVK